jgi:hypothetical protein
MSKAVTNTAERPRLEWLLGGNPGAIEAQEARGQQEFVNSTQLPDQGSDNKCWEAMGVVFGEPTPGDQLFRAATLPEGWKKVATDHAMWSDLVDDKGRVRANIFYKAAFYDRNAHISPARRFGIQKNYDDGRNRDACQHFVVDGKKRVFSTEDVVVTGDWDKKNAVDKGQYAACEAWLSERYPNWLDPSAHWED